MDRRPDLCRLLPHGRAVDVVAPTHGHFDHVGDDAADVVELARAGGTVVGSHEMSLYLGEKGVEAVGMNKGGTFEAAGIRFTMVHAEHSGAVTLSGWAAPPAARSAAGAGSSTSRTAPASITRATPTCSATWRWSASAGRLRSRSCRLAGTTPWGRRMPRRAVGLIGAHTVIPVHYGTFPILAGTPDALAAETSAHVVALEPGETWEA